jgi:hypothetical protein
MEAAMSATASFELADSVSSIRNSLPRRRARLLAVISKIETLFWAVGLILLFSCGTMGESRSMTTQHKEEITKQHALEIARKAIADLKLGTELVLLEDKTLEKDFGWVFFNTTKKYLETKNPNDLLPGIGPLVVERSDGSTHFLSTSLPPNKAIEEFEHNWQKNRKTKR